MSSLTAIEQLAIDAFATALETCREEGIELPFKIQAVEMELEQHTAELSALAQTHPQFHTFYRNARKALRRASAPRNKRLTNSTDLDPVEAPPSFQHNPEPSNQPSSEASLQAENTDPTTQTSPNHSLEDPVTSSDSRVSNLSPASSSHTKHQSSPPIQRFVLPHNSTTEERQFFNQYIHELKQLNPSWVVSPAPRQTWEADAYVMIYRDHNYAVNHASYLVSQVLDKAFQQL